MEPLNDKQLNATAVAQAQAKQLAIILYELQKIELQFILSEKMFNLKEIVAEVLHEINNPVNFIAGNLAYTITYIEDFLKILQLYQQHYPDPHPQIREQIELSELSFLIEDLPRILDSLKLAVDRICQVVLSVRKVLEADEFRIGLVNIHECVENIIFVLQHRLKANGKNYGITINRFYSYLPLIECYQSSINAVIMSLLSNAIDELESYDCQRSEEEICQYPSQITIETKVLNGDKIAICIADNGLGITESSCQQLFEPFFTTKPVGRSTGLGLSISHQIIVEKHKGKLECKSQLGQGRQFWIELPISYSQSSTIP